MDSFFQAAQILVSVLLVAVILIQIRGQGSGFFGSGQASFRTRRGVEKTLFQGIIVLAVVFTLLAIVSAIQPSWLF
ncbi:MAG: preprotein translocase subunit SecG [Chloroflexi bacterium]|nr:preprotein translocase subunit SecG [Chloroflexota bacterium]